MDIGSSSRYGSALGAFHIACQLSREGDEEHSDERCEA